MAVFKLNICKYNNCNLIFNNLENLIRHIETSHINYDPKVIEQYESEQPACLPLSYVLRFFGDIPVEKANECTTSKLKQTLLSAKPTQPITNANVKVELERIGNGNIECDKKSGNWVAVKTATRVPVFKNICKVKKAFKCHCGKSYGTSLNLKKHTIRCHDAAVVAQVKEILQGPETTGVSKIVQPYQSISLKPISNSGTPLKTLVVSPTVPQPSQRVMIQISDLNSITSS